LLFLHPMLLRCIRYHADPSCSVEIPEERRNEDSPHMAELS
jgi:hypothetical protein